MLGRVRPLSSSLSSLDSLERPSPKIVKHDSLSIYEATIMKLKLASQCEMRPIEEDSMTTKTGITSSVSESSQNELSSSSMEAVEMNMSKQTNYSSASFPKGYKLSPSSSTYEEEMAFDASGVSLGCSDCQSMTNLMKQQEVKNLSIADMFSKYKKRSQQAQTSACEETM